MTQRLQRVAANPQFQHAADVLVPGESFIAFDLQEQHVIRVIDSATPPAGVSSNREPVPGRQGRHRGR
jgi:hypothetical protein